MASWRSALAFAVCFALGSCALQRAQVANEAQSKMIGLTKEQVLACMGPPVGKAGEGATEVWSYNSGDGRVTINTFGTSNTNATVAGDRYSATGQASTVSSAVGIGRQRYCTINVTMAEGRVSRVNYVGPTGGLLTAGEQCAFAVENCTR